MQNWLSNFQFCQFSPLTFKFCQFKAPLQICYCCQNDAVFHGFFYFFLNSELKEKSRKKKGEQRKRDSIVKLKQIHPCLWVRERESEPVWDLRERKRDRERERLSSPVVKNLATPARCVNLAAPALDLAALDWIGDGCAMKTLRTEGVMALYMILLWTLACDFASSIYS